MPFPNNTLIGTFNPSTVTDTRIFSLKDHSDISTSFGTITCNINNNSNCDLIDTAEDVSSIVDGVEVEKMELKKRLYKSYKSRKLSNPSTKSRRRHMQSNR
ncbi:hypothetical protein MACK_003667 [Theileria orientalis]|uniref:Uncharacterized protein n=1 Tax=Theileria orientalis TaxID=68886 RepID=A0A976SJI2_THEOR|nr:hypothetical protein MACK_003667 [Theileria orientalis]